MSKNNFWKIPFLFLIAVLGWVLLFPGQFEKIGDIFSEAAGNAKESRNEAKLRESRDSIFLDTICAKELGGYLSYFVVPIVPQLTNLAPLPGMGNGRQRERKNCAIAFWTIVGTNFFVSAKDSHLPKCHPKGCAQDNICPPEGFLLGSLVKACK